MDDGRWMMEDELALTMGKFIYSPRAASVQTATLV